MLLSCTESSSSLMHHLRLSAKTTLSELSSNSTASGSSAVSRILGLGNLRARFKVLEALVIHAPISNSLTKNPLKGSIALARLNSVSLPFRPPIADLERAAPLAHRGRAGNGPSGLDALRSKQLTSRSLSDSSETAMKSTLPIVGL
jgi:hypothetical protein